MREFLRRNRAAVTLAAVLALASGAGLTSAEARGFGGGGHFGGSGHFGGGSHFGAHFGGGAGFGDRFRGTRLGSFGPGYGYVAPPVSNYEVSPWALGALGDNWMDGAPAFSTLSPADSDRISACEHRYHSFDPASGTYLGYDGRRHICQS
jgi:hypothetical protein